MLNIIFIFVIYSVLGWVIETVFFFIKTKKYVQRGLLGGPYCPLYGFSIALCSIVSYQISNNLFYLFLINTVICTTFELMTGILIEKFKGEKMWDYSCLKYNLNGHICLKYSIIWGILSTFSVQVLNPIILVSKDTVSNIVKIIFTCFIIIMMLMNFMKIKYPRKD